MATDLKMVEYHYQRTCHAGPLLHVKVGIQVSLLQIRRLELRKVTFLVKGQLVTSMRTRMQIQVRSTLGCANTCHMETHGRTTWKLMGQGSPTCQKAEFHQVRRVSAQRDSQDWKNNKSGLNWHLCCYTSVQCSPIFCFPGPHAYFERLFSLLNI